MKNFHKPTRTNFISNGLLFTSALIFAAFSYSEKATIKKELHKSHGTVIKYQSEEKKEKVTKPSKRKVITQKQAQKKTIDLRNKATQQIKTITNKPTSTNSVTLAPTGITFDSNVVYKVIPVEPDIVDFPDTDAAFKGGYNEMNRFIVHNLNLNKIELQDVTEFLVNVEFIINKEGVISEIKTRKRYAKSIEKEVFRMINSMPRWIPGEVQGRKVKSRVRIPIHIYLQ